MAQGRTWFIPWNANQSGDFGGEAAQGISKSHHKRKIEVFYKDSPGKPLAKIGAGFGTRIHIAGHGAIGDPELGADHGTGGADVGIKELVDMMFEKGLTKRYLGTIVCDVCYSALGSPSYAKLLARELYARGLKGSCVMGYKGPLGAAYSSELGGKYTHRVVDVEDSAGNVIDTVKSKQMQERFWGFN